MPKHALMWWAAGGGALAGAMLTYWMTRSALVPSDLAPLGSKVRSGVSSVANRARSATSWFARKAEPDTAARDTRHVSRATAPAPTGHSAFDAYRDGVLRQLDQDANDFAAFLDRLRFARDREEFEAYLADRRQRNS